MPADRTHERIELSLPNRFSALKTFDTALDQLAGRHGFDHDLVYRLRLCGHEIVGNIVSYAFTDRAPHDIELRVAVGDDRISLSVSDDGRPFNPLEQPQPPKPASLEQAQIGGLGIPLMRTFAGSIAYARHDGRNIVTMHFPRDPAARTNNNIND